MNAVAETSLRAFVNGLDSLSQRRREAADAVFAHPNMTGRELEALTGKRKINARLAEIEKLGFVVRGAARVCTITGFEAFTWRARRQGEPATGYASPPSWKIKAERAEKKLALISKRIDDFAKIVGQNLPLVVDIREILQ